MEASRAERSWRAVVRVLRRPGRLAAGAAITVLDDLCTTMVPAACRLCEYPLLRAGSVPVCQECLAQLRTNQPMGCERCGDTFDLDEPIDLEDARFARGASAYGVQCRACRLASPAFTRAVAYGAYCDELRELIHLLKFERVASVAPLLGQRLAEAMLLLDGAAARELLVVAVPLFAARERQRGYNQSVLLADAAVQRMRTLRPAWTLTRAHSLLRRKRRTESQFALSQRDRRRNLQGAFAVHGNVRGREVLLIDDIMTSGATARECARVLVQAGATQVWVATVARAHGEQAMKRQESDATIATWDLALPVPAALADAAAAGRV